MRTASKFLSPLGGLSRRIAPSFTAGELAIRTLSARFNGLLATGLSQKAGRTLKRPGNVDCPFDPAVNDGAITAGRREAHKTALS